MNNTYEIEKNIPVPNPETEIQRLIKIANRTTELKKQLLEKREKVIKLKPSLPEVLTPRKWHPTLIQFKVEPQHVAKLEFEDTEDKRKKPVIVHHVFPKLSEYQAGLISDEQNPRSHGLESLKTTVAKQIENTLREKPGSFHLMNRGSVILCHSFEYDPETQMATIKLTDPELHSLLDGATSDRVVAKVQKTLIGNRKLSEIPEEEMPHILKTARIHLEILENLAEKDKMVDLTESRNVSIKVRSYSIADLRGQFQFIKDVLEGDGSEFKDRVGYEENSPQDVSILEILAILTLFHPEWNQKNDEGDLKAPVIAYSSKGRLDTRLLNDEILPGYKMLTPILKDILKLHDYIYSTFDQKYQETVRVHARLARRAGFESLDTPYELPLTGAKTNYIISGGIIYPILGAFRALVGEADGVANWTVDPFKFWDRHGSTLVRHLIAQLSKEGTPNALGKSKLTYINLHREVKLLTLEKN